MTTPARVRASGAAQMEVLERRMLLSADFDRDGLADLVWHAKGSQQVVIHFGNGEAAPQGTVPAEWDVEAYGDFNADGNDDILWRNHATGENLVWLMNREDFSSAAALPQVEANSGWEIAGVGNFAGNSRPDILWRNVYTGDISVWVMADEDTIAFGDSIEGNADGQWHIAGIADFNDDGRDDIFWRADDDGENVVWLMNGTTRTSVTNLPDVVGREWSVAAVGNFTGSSDDDILWRRATDGAHIAWRIENMQVVGSETEDLPIQGDWHAGGGDNRSRGDDWDRNGTEDLLWLDSQNGRGLQWYMDGATTDGTNTINNLGQQVRGLQAVGDFDGQRGIDFVVRDEDTGQVSILLRVGGTMNFIESNKGIFDQIDLAAVDDPAWQIEGVADFNGDEWLDILWRHMPSGGMSVWTLVNGRYAGSMILPAVVDTAWDVRAVGSNDAADTASIYWHNSDTGENVVWIVSGESVEDAVFLFPVTDSSWELQHATDLGNDGVLDAIWVNTASEEVRVWLYDAAGYAGSSVLGERPTANSDLIS